MNFAHWRRIKIPVGLVTGPDSEHIRYIGQELIVEHFIVDIPEGTMKDDVKAKLVGILFTCGGRGLNDSDSFGFEDTWPLEILRQFKDNRDAAKKWSWPHL